jgi:hypothetical protein
MSAVQEQLETKIVSVPDQARALTIQTNDEYVRAGELLRTIKGLRGEVDQSFDPIIQKAHEAHREAIAQKRKIEAPLAEAEGILKPRIAAYLNEQERIRREEELRLQRQAEEEARQRQLENAVILDDIGETEEANALLEERPTVAPVILPRSVPKVAGVSMSKRYSAVVTNLMELVKAVAVGKAPIQALKADDVFLNRQAVAMKEALQYPGVRIHIESNISAKRQ